MSENHLLEYIEIKDFKCFKNFKAEGFKRVNLIGGKNNVGKTALMEACYLGINTESEKNFFHSLLVLELNRNPLKEFEIIEDTNSFEFKFDNSIIKINNKFCSLKLDIFNDNMEQSLYYIPSKNYDNGILELKEFYKGKNKPLEIKNNSFISQTSLRQNNIIDFIDDIKLLKKWKELNSLLLSNFNIEEIDVIKDKVLLLKEDNHISLSEFGDGLKQFILIILSLYLNKSKIIFLDEIENGIHYSLFDNLWKIILTISKEQNVQVFATTHSKECIESYARVSKKLEESKEIDKDDICFIELGRNKKNELKSIVYNYEMIQSEIEQNHEIRGW
ncbi:MAG: AAA family ATPase [Campylobacterota bacterium]|nr:AAA family ATPase [Campylobacterota bacterium]